MKVLYIDPQSAYNLAQYDYNLLSNMNAKIAYCCSKSYDAPIMERVTYYPIFNYNRRKNVTVKLFSYIFSIVRVFFIALKFKPNVVHIQWWRVWEIDFLFLCLLKLITKNIVFTAHNLEPHDSKGRYKGRCKRYYEKTSKIIVHSPITKKSLVKEYGIVSEKIFVIPHGLLSLNIDENQVQKHMEDYSLKYSLKDKFVITSMGVQSFYKGTDIIWNTFVDNDFLCRNQNVVLLFVGRGDIIDESLMREYSNVYLVNRMVTDAEFVAFLKLSSLTIFPYTEISQSGVLLTAIDYQVPFLVSDAGGLTDPLTYGKVGWCMGDANVKNLSLTLKYLIENPDEVAFVKHNVNVWKSVKSHFDWGNISCLTMKCYQAELK